MRNIKPMLELACVTLLMAAAPGCSTNVTVPYSNAGLSTVQALPFSDARIKSTLFVANFEAMDVLLYPAGKNNPPPSGTISQGLTNSYNLAVDRAGTLYVQGNNNTITEFPKGSRKPSKVLNEPPAGPYKLGTGVCVAVGTDGTVYATDLYGSELFEFAGGAKSPTTTIDISHPFGLALDSKNNLYVDYTYSPSGYDARVMKFAPGQIKGSDLGIQVKLIGGLNVDSSDNLLVGDQGNEVIDIFKPGATRPFRTIATAPNYPYQFAFDRSEGRLYLVSGHPAVYVYDYATGKLLWTDTQGLSPSGSADGVALSPAAPSMPR